MSDPPDKTSPEELLRGLELDWDRFDFDRIFKREGERREPEPPAPESEAAVAGSPPEDSSAGRDKYKILLEISKQLSAKLVLDDLLVEVLDTVLAVTRMEKGFLMLRDEDGRFRVRVARDRERRSLREEEFRVSRGVIREAARTGRPIYIADIEKKPAADEAAGGRRATISFPLKGSTAPRADRLWGAVRPEEPGEEPPRHRIIGLIYVERPLASAEFPGVDLEFIEALAGNASVAIENARLYEQLARDRLVLADENQDLRREVRRKYAFENMVGTSDRMRAVYDLIARVSQATVNVLLRGESGTGKEVVAKTIHYNSERAKKPFVSVNCAALPETLLESELFGIEKGVATGVTKRIGKFELANGGTFFLDEIGDMSLPIQAKLLRVIEAREIERVGGKTPLPVDVRLIAATNRDLEAAIRDGGFREDLYFRLNVVPIYLPALRERKSDLPELVEHFIRKHADPQGKRIEGVTRAALEALLRYDWPGNVRELENVLQRAILMCDSNLIDVEDLPPEVFERRTALLAKALHEGWTADRLVKEYAAKLLERNKGNLTRTARELGLDFKTLKKKIEEHKSGV